LPFPAGGAEPYPSASYTLTRRIGSSPSNYCPK